MLGVIFRRENVCSILTHSTNYITFSSPFINLQTTTAVAKFRKNSNFQYSNSNISPLLNRNIHFRPFDSNVNMRLNCKSFNFSRNFSIFSHVQFYKSTNWWSNLLQYSVIALTLIFGVHLTSQLFEKLLLDYVEQCNVLFSPVLDYSGIY